MRQQIDSRAPKRSPYAVVAAIVVAMAGCTFDRLVRAGLDDHGDGTIGDYRSGLVWERDGAPERLHWVSADQYCKDLALSGHRDWRLPTQDELTQLYIRLGFVSQGDKDRRHEPFGWTAAHYWTSTEANGPDEAWVIYFDGGYVVFGPKTFMAAVRCVRGSDAEPTNS